MNKQIFHEFKIAGMRFYPAHRDLELAVQDELTLIPEPDNPYAKHPAGALAVAKRGVKIGHVPEADLAKMHPVAAACQCIASYVDLSGKYPTVIVCAIV